MQRMTAIGTPAATRTLCTVLWLCGMGVVAGACNKTPSEEAAAHQASNVEQQGEQRAQQLRTQAAALEQQASQRAGAIRAQATVVEHQAEQTAEQIRTAAAQAVQNAHPPAAGGSLITVTSAREQYAVARCNREASCNAIGSGRTYISLEACMTTARADRFESWNTTACTTGGIDSVRFAACLIAVRAQACGNPIDDMLRMNDCRGGTLCSAPVAARQ